MSPYIPAHGDDREDDKSYGTLTGGISIRVEGSEKPGTLGWFATKNNDQTKVLLTNKHVIYEDSKEIRRDKLKIGQSTYCNSHCCEPGYRADSIIGIKNSEVDCAIAVLRDNVEIATTITNSKTGKVLTVSGWAQAKKGETVRKIGRSSGYTEGIVISLGNEPGDGIINDPMLGDVQTYMDQLHIRPTDGETYEERSGNTDKKSFAALGDSGAVVLNEKDQIVGLIHSLNDESRQLFSSARLTYANHIDKVLNAFENEGHAITLMVSDQGDRSHLSTNTISHHHGGDISGKDSAVGILESLARDESLKPVRTLLEIHRNEVLSLVNKHRPLTVAWHRNQGPAFFAAFMRSIKEPAYRIPPELHDVPREQLLHTMAALLREQASDQLRRDLAAHGEGMTKAFRKNHTAEDIIRGINTLLEEVALDGRFSWEGNRSTQK